MATPQELSKMSAQELLALAKSQLQGVQKTKDEISASGGFTEQGLTKATSSLSSANQKLAPSLTPENRQKVTTTYQNTLDTYKPPAIDVDKAQKSIVNLSPSARASNYTTLSTALQDAVTYARAQRQNAELDFLGGVIPKGAVTSSTFTRLLSNLNKASNQFTQPLTENVLEFAQQEQLNAQEQLNSIRDLALAAVENGASQDVVSGILNASDLDAAISMAAGALNTKSKETIEKVGSNLVAYDKDGNVRVIYSADGSTNTSPSSTPRQTNQRTSTIPDYGIGSDFDFMQDTDKNVRAKAKQMFSPDFANKLITELTNEELRLFLNDLVATENEKGMSIDPATYYTQWKGALSNEEETSTSSSTKRAP